MSNLPRQPVRNLLELTPCHQIGAVTVDVLPTVVSIREQSVLQVATRSAANRRDAWSFGSSPSRKITCIHINAVIRSLDRKVLPVCTNVHGPATDCAVACSMYLALSFFENAWYTTLPSVEGLYTTNVSI